MIDSLATGLPVLILHFAVTVTILAIGVAAYLWMTPYKELELIKGGNVAAAVAMSGAILSMAMPLAISLSVSVSVLDILAWGGVILVILLLVYKVIDFMLKDLAARIEAGEIGAAILLSAVKLAVAMVTAAAVSG